ncbi:hypothetical protein ENUP19_0006G0010 [Entamoeba nuttalli]|uniref:non-specific serine/threonine protein kinase n=2 Tax=Entamoeba nuttalli TaxID=412467 RepID=K2HBZ7_ENTNP|nr:protein kinase, putative [Entamoeba nuttalli P19]EKE40169.1 protein kinase, putative [Entamoeba nuttalli P19]|eukprot:XP_008857493.1 protein kinase, putative [Entamoeba nuttalli P19]
MTSWGRLVCFTPGLPSLEIYDETIVLGRNNHKTKIHEACISGNHCSIKKIVTDGAPIQYLLTDTSTNGTYVNGEKVGRGKTVTIRSYDEITLLDKKVAKCAIYMFESYLEKNEELVDGGPQDKYEFLDLCGVGNFAVVRKVKEIQTGEVYAMKMIDLQKAQGVSKRENAILDECEILKRLDHPNIIKLKEVYQTTKYLYMVIELVTGGELFDQIVAETHFTEAKCRIIIRQIFSALEYLHSQNIIHRDLKPENILCVKSGTDEIKITDFGLSRIINPETLAKTMCGTPLYVSPEILSGKPYNGSKVDVWSTGVVLYVMACGFPPFVEGENDGNRMLFDNILAGKFEFRSPFWDNKSLELKDLIKHMLVVDPEERYSIEDCVNHPFMKMKISDEQLKRTVSDIVMEEPKDKKGIEELSKYSYIPK